MDEGFPKKAMLWWMDAEVYVVIYDFKPVCVGDPVYFLQNFCD